MILIQFSLVKLLSCIIKRPQKDKQFKIHIKFVRKSWGRNHAPLPPRNNEQNESIMIIEILDNTSKTGNIRYVYLRKYRLSLIVIQHGHKGSHKIPIQTVKGHENLDDIKMLHLYFCCRLLEKS